MSLAFSAKVEMGTGTGTGKRTVDKQKKRVTTVFADKALKATHLWYLINLYSVE